MEILLKYARISKRVRRDLGKSLNFVAQNRSLGVGSGGGNSWKSGGKFPKIWSWGGAAYN